MTGFDLERGTWTCPHCQITIGTTSPITAGVHRVRCPDAPDPEQTDLQQFSGGAA